MTLRLSHLALLIACTTVVTAVLGVVTTYRTAGEELREVLDDDLEGQSRMLARLLRAEGAGNGQEDLQALLRKAFRPDDEETVWVNVYDITSGRLASNLDHDLALASPDNGDISLWWDGHAWEGHQRREGDLVVQLLRREDLYLDIQDDILEDIVAPALTGSAINLALLAALIGLALWPLARLSRALESRNADSLAPVDVPAPAEEIRVLRDTLNRLISDVDSVLRRERQFANDVAHELRTPLTTLKVELAAPEPDVTALKNEVNRLSRLVEQLLTLARLEQGRWRAAVSPVALHELWADESARLAGLLDNAGMTLEADIQPAIVPGEPALLQALLWNLLGNVVRHCPPGTHARVRIGKRDGRAVLMVSDSGSGIDLEVREQLNRGHAHLDSRSEGLGLGLAICQRIASVHGATLTFLANETGEPGLRVEVSFGT